MTPRYAHLDGNEACARVAHRLSEVVAIYPITPASAMGELSDAWSAAGRTNLWGTVPEVLEMQSEAGAAGVLHGAAQKGALACTFTASQGLLLMIPELYKLAGELLPSVVHVAARALATHALSIFGDHSDVMACRATGFAMLCSASPQEAQDLALVAHAAALRTRVPVLHFFDGFRTSHEVSRVTLLEDADLRALVNEEDLLAHRARGLSPEHPVLRGSAQNPDVFFQAREACEPFHRAVPEAVRALFEQLAQRTGRRYDLVEYTGAPDAERVLLLMGSGRGAAREAVEALRARGERVGLLQVRLYRPFPTEALLAALPPTVRALAVLDRTKEPGSVGEPLLLDVLAALSTARPELLARVYGGRYGLASKEFTPAMVAGVLRSLGDGSLPRRFTVGIVDDVSRSSVAPVAGFFTDRAPVRALFHGVGSDGSVSATKLTAKVLGEAGRCAQHYAVYDSRKAGQQTACHLRVSDAPVDSPYLLERANFVALGQRSTLERLDLLATAERGATVLLNAPGEGRAVWDLLPAEVQREVLERELVLWSVDADRLAREEGLEGLVGIALQPCFFALTGALPAELAVERLGKSLAATRGSVGEELVARNLRLLARSVASMKRVEHPRELTATHARRPAVPPQAPDFVQRVTARMLAGEGDLLPVSAMPPDGTFPTGTARWEKRMLAEQLPAWSPERCIDCGKCALVCPHAALRLKAFAPALAEGAPSGFAHKPLRGKELPDARLSIQVAPDDCTGCGLCVEACPVEGVLGMTPVEPVREAQREAWEFFLRVPDLEPGEGPSVTSLKGSQLRPPLFEFSGACAGCGETPYLKLLSQLFGDRMVIANATGCSSIFGGNLPTTPWSVDSHGRGPAWANSLFEDNAEFGLGMRVAYERQREEAQRLLRELAPTVGEGLAAALLEAKQADARGVAEQRERVEALREKLRAVQGASARSLESLAEQLLRRSIWIVGGDGWAYDIGFGGLDHVLASGRDVNVLVLDTEVYSNTGGQASKATPRAAVARFAAAGKRTAKKDLGRIASTYEGVYVAQVALGADDKQTLRVLLEADAFEGPSLVLAYSPCVAHGADLCASLAHQKHAVHSGHWPLYHRDPRHEGKEPLAHLDQKAPEEALEEFERSEPRFAVARKDLGDAHVHLLTLATHDAKERWRALELAARAEH